MEYSNVRERAVGGRGVGGGIGGAGGRGDGGGLGSAGGRGGSIRGAVGATRGGAARYLYLCVSGRGLEFRG